MGTLLGVGAKEKNLLVINCARKYLPIRRFTTETTRVLDYAVSTECIIIIIIIIIIHFGNKEKLLCGT